MKLVIKDHYTYTTYGTVDNVTLLPNNGDSVFFKNNEGQSMATSCKGRIISYTDDTAVLLVDRPKPLGV